MHHRAIETLPYEDGLKELAWADSLLAPLAAVQPCNLDLQIDYWRVFAYRVADSADSRKHVGLASIHQSMGEILVKQNKLREARPHFEQSLAIRQRLYERDPNNGEVAYTVASTLQALCSLLHTESKLNDAIGLCEKAATIQEAAVASDPQNAIGQEALYDISLLTARIYAQMARQLLVAESQREHLRTALDWYDRSLTLIETLEAQGVTYTWNTPPDTVQAERAALAEQYL